MRTKFKPTETRKYLEALFENAQGQYLELRFFRPITPGETQTEHKFFKIPEEFNEAILFTKEYAGLYHCYTGAAPRVRKSGKKKDVETLVGAWVDVDGKDFIDSDNFRDAQHGKKQALQNIEDFPLEPSFIIDSGNGYQALWLFDEPWNITDPQERKKAEKLLKNLAKVLESDKYSTDLPRVLRLPGTPNIKDPDNHTIVTDDPSEWTQSRIERKTNRRYTPGELLQVVADILEERGEELEEKRRKNIKTTPGEFDPDEFELNTDLDDFEPSPWIPLMIADIQEHGGHHEQRVVIAYELFNAGMSIDQGVEYFRDVVQPPDFDEETTREYLEYEYKYVHEDGHQKYGPEHPAVRPYVKDYTSSPEQGVINGERIRLAREEMREAIRNPIGDGYIYRFNIVPGVGKTRTMIDELIKLNREKDVKSTVFMPTHELINEWIAYIQANYPGVKVLRLEGAGRIDPILSQENKWSHLMNKGFSPLDLHSWDQFPDEPDGCPYMQQFKKTKNADIILAPPQFQHVKTATEDRIVVYDDIEINALRTETVIPKREVEKAALVFDYIDNTTAFKRVLHETPELDVRKFYGNYQIIKHSIEDDEILEEIKWRDWIKYAIKNNLSKFALDAFIARLRPHNLHETQDTIKERIIAEEHGENTYDVRILRPKKTEKHRDTFILNGGVKNKAFQPYFHEQIKTVVKVTDEELAMPGTRVIKHTPRRNPVANNNPTLLDKTRKNYQRDMDHLTSKLEKAINECNELLVISAKKFFNKLEREKDEHPELYDLIFNQAAGHLWWGNLKGKNEYKTFDGAFILGHQAPPDRTIELDAKLHGTEAPTEIDHRRKELDYGKADYLYHYHVLQRLYQGAHRIRLMTSRKATVYFYTSVIPDQFKDIVEQEYEPPGRSLVIKTRNVLENIPLRNPSPEGKLARILGVGAAWLRRAVKHYGGEYGVRRVDKNYIFETGSFNNKHNLRSEVDNSTLPAAAEPPADQLKLPEAACPGPV